MVAGGVFHPCPSPPPAGWWGRAPPTRPLPGSEVTGCTRCTFLARRPFSDRAGPENTAPDFLSLREPRGTQLGSFLDSSGGSPSAPPSPAERGRAGLPVPAARVLVVAPGRRRRAPCPFPALLTLCLCVGSCAMTISLTSRTTSTRSRVTAGP